MRKLLLLVVCLIFLTNNYAQTPSKVDVDSMLVNIDQTALTTGVLYERVAPLSRLDIFNDSINVSSTNYFEQALNELHKSSQGEKFIDYKSLRELYSPDSLQYVVDIGILNASFNLLNYVEGNENSGALRINNDTFEKIENGKPIFNRAHTFMVSPLKMYVVGEEIRFKFSGELLFEDTEETNLQNLVANFDGVTDHIIINNGQFVVTEMPVTYVEDGLKTLTFSGTFQDGSEVSTQANIHVRLPVPPANSLIENGSIWGNIPFQGFNESAAYIGKLDFRIFYRTNNGNNQAILNKPIVIIDGFDPGDKRKIQDSDPHPMISNADHESIEEMMVYRNSNNEEVSIISELRGLGYDVVIVNHPIHWANGFRIDGGADYIERNGLTHVRLYQYLNNLLVQNGSNEELVIVGPSMGGQISRYALAYMEKEGIPHNTRLWVSIDSPHLGANIPIGAQSLLHTIWGVTGSVAAEDFVINQLGSPAARQQLIEQYSGENNGNLNSYFLDGRTISQGFNVNRGRPIYINYYNHLYNNGLPGSNGYPLNLRKIALVNGSLTNSRGFVNPFEPGSTAITQNPYNDLFATHGIQSFKIEGDGNGLGHITTMETYIMPDSGNNHKVSFFKKYSLGRWYYYDGFMTNTNSRGNMDNVPGGWFPTQRTLAKSIENSVPCNWFIGQLCVNDWYIHSLEHVNSFIPTVSALGFNNPDFDWDHDMDRNLVCTGEIPFDSYYGPRKNEQHTSFTEESIQWLIQELEGNEQPPTVYPKAADINGPYVVCSGDIVTYSFDQCKSATVDHWEVSPNLTMITSDPLSVTVELANPNATGQAFVRAVYSNYSVEKSLWLGIPASATSISGPTEVDTGAIVTYNGHGAEGATSFKWWLPYPFDENVDVRNPIDYTGDNWQTWPDSGRRNYHVFTGNGGHNGLVQFFGENSCGTGGSAHIEVEHTNNGSCTTCYNPVFPYPNTADESFSLDFTSYPPGNYYIYVYDAYSNVLYQGEATNIEKTIDTINIPNGVYYLHIHDGNEILVYQLIIQH